MTKSDTNLQHLPFHVITHMNIQAFMAVRAARNLKKWGLYSTLGYCKNRNVPNKLFYLALSLQIEDDKFSNMGI